MNSELLRKKYLTKSLPWLLKKCQELVNAYVRQRDSGNPCISCGQDKELQAGHFYSVGEYSALRFDLDNINGECLYCNYYSGDHLIKYRKNLILKIGKERFEKLELNADIYKKYGKKWNKFELIDLIIKMKN